MAVAVTTPPCCCILGGQGHFCWTNGVSIRRGIPFKILFVFEKSLLVVVAVAVGVPFL